MDEADVGIIVEKLGNYGFNRVIAYALRFVLRNPYENFIVVDTDAKVQFMDRGSEKFFGLAQGEAKGVDIREYVPGSGLPTALSTGSAMIGRIFKVKDTQSIGSVYPIVRDGRIIGAVGRIIFHSLEEVQRVNNEVSRLKEEIHYFREKEQKEQSSKYTFEDILGISASLRDAVDFARKIALVDTDVLIIGESGTGKELFAHSIHSRAHRNRPFIKVNCPTIPFELAESELFGYSKGAFTGALSSGKTGKFEAAHNGTIFLDEISSLPLSIQAKLLRVLQEREIEKLGSTRTEKIRFKLVAATNVDLRTLVREGKFREDLYYRISKAIVHIPPLRERRDDIPVLVAHFLGKINQSFKTRVPIASHRVIDMLSAYHWPGNVRELINVLEQAVLKASNEGGILESHLPSEIVSRIEGSATRSEGGSRAGAAPYEETEDEEKQRIISAIRAAKGNRRKAGDLLGMPRSTLYVKIRRYNIGMKHAGRGKRWTGT
jgi:transcriptional regulator with PAS, ATPase and Fis domain